MKIDITSGAAIAAAAAALLIAGTALSAPMRLAADDAKGHCMGANACKGRARARPQATPARARMPARARASWR